MTKEILLSVKGLHYQGMDRNDEIETITPAEYYDKGDSHYVLYEEIMEGMEVPVKNVVKFKNSYLEITKKGPLSVHLLFEEGKKNLTSYATPFGSILIGVDTEEVEVRKEEHSIDIRVKYTLEANYEFLADCELSMELRENGQSAE